MHPNRPLISCIMSTSGRAGYVEQAVDMFLRQDYARKELVIVYSRDGDIPAVQLPPAVRLVRTGTQVAGNKRNEACRHAQGLLICHWDDDGMYNDDRLRLQAEPILSGQAEVTGLSAISAYDTATGRCMPLSGMAFAQLYGRVAGCSLMYHRHAWDRLSNYPNITGGEDAAYLQRIMKRGARLLPLNGIDTYITLKQTTATTQRPPTTLPEWAQRYATAYRNMGRPQPVAAPLTQVYAPPALPRITSIEQGSCVPLG